MIPRYSMPEMAGIWTDETKYKLWLNIEIEAMKAMIKKRVIPLCKTDIENIDKIVNKLDMNIFIKRCLKEEQKTHHDVVAFINILEKYLDPKIGRFIHYGLTSSDLCDTQYALQMKYSLHLIDLGLKDLKTSLRHKADHYKHTPIMGRTHGRKAEPTTFGLVLLLYVEEINRHIDRLYETAKRASVGKLSGAVGNYAHINPQIEKMVMKELGIEYEPISNQIVQRDRHAEVFNLLALIGCTIEKLATQIRHYSRTEINEVLEPFGKKQKGSSAMPHKRNPIKSENICGMARLLRAYAQSALENVALLHERDISHSSVERIIGPDSFGILYFMITRMDSIINNMEVNTISMMNNILDTPWISQHMMLQDIKTGKSRKKAHDAIQKMIKPNYRYYYKNHLNHHLRWTDHIFKRIK